MTSSLRGLFASVEMLAARQGHTLLRENGAVLRDTNLIKNVFYLYNIILPN